MTIYEVYGDSPLDLFHPLQDDDSGYEVEDTMTPKPDSSLRAARPGFTVADAYRRRLASLWPYRHSHPRFREWIRQTVRQLRESR